MANTSYRGHTTEGLLLKNVRQAYGVALDPNVLISNVRIQLVRVHLFFKLSVPNNAMEIFYKQFIKSYFH